MAFLGGYGSFMGGAANSMGSSYAVSGQYGGGTSDSSFSQNLVSMSLGRITGPIGTMMSFFGAGQVAEFNKLHGLNTPYAQQKIKESEAAFRKAMPGGSITNFKGGVNALNPWFGGQLSSTAQSYGPLKSGIVHSVSKPMTSGSYGNSALARSGSQMMNIRPTINRWAPQSGGRFTGGFGTFGKTGAQSLYSTLSQDALKHSPWGNLQVRNTYFAGSRIAPNMILKNSTSSIKSPSGYGQSSMDTSTERYSTKETRLGQYNEAMYNEDIGKDEMSKKGFKTLHVDTVAPKGLKAQLAQMYKYKDPNVGYARRAISAAL